MSLILLANSCTPPWPHEVLTTCPAQSSASGRKIPVRAPGAAPATPRSARARSAATSANGPSARTPLSSSTNPTARYSSTAATPQGGFSKRWTLPIVPQANHDVLQPVADGRTLGHETSRALTRNEDSPDEPLLHRCLWVPLLSTKRSSPRGLRTSSPVRRCSPHLAYLRTTTEVPMNGFRHPKDS